MVQAFLRLLALLFEDSRDKLLKARPETFAPLQGECLAFQRAISEVITPPLPPPQPLPHHEGL